MASAESRKNVVDLIKDMTLCCICSDTIIDARVLPCLHTFCLDCLRQAGSNISLYYNPRMNCPICRQEFPIPREGFAGIKKNFIVENLIDVVRNSEMEMEMTEQSLSPLDEDVNLVVNRPVSEFPCDACLETIEVGEDLADMVPAPSGVVYCTDCQQCLCQLCHRQHRRNVHTKHHRLSNDENLVAGFRRDLSNQVDAVSTWMDEGSTIKRKLEEGKTRFVEALRQGEEEVIARKEEAKRMVEERAQSSLLELSTVKEIRVREMDMEIDELDGHLAVLESFRGRCIHAKDSDATDGIIVCRVADDLKSTADDLREMHESLFLRENTGNCNISFKPTTLDELLINDRIKTSNERQENSDEGGETSIITASVKSSEGVIEEIDSENSIDRQHKSTFVLFSVVFTLILAAFLHHFIPNSSPISLNLTATLTDEDRFVTGVATLDNNLYVLSRSPRSIYVYRFHEDSSFEFRKEITIPEIKSPRDIAASSLCRCLYVTDKGNSCIWKISLKKEEEDEDEDGNGGWFFKGSSTSGARLWLSGVVEPYTLSASDDGSVLVMKSGDPLSFLERYGPDGVLIQSVQLPAEVDDPRHAVETTMGSFIVSYGWTGSRTRGVCELSDEGRIFRCYDSTWQQLTNPHHLATDTENGRVYVADFYNNQISVLESSLDWDQRILLTEGKDGILKPHRLCFAKEKRSLIVVHNEGTNIQVYSVQ